MKANLAISQIPFTDRWGSREGRGREGGREVPPKKVAKNDVKYILVLEFLRSEDFLGVYEKIPFVKIISTGQHTYRHTYRRHSD